MSGAASRARLGELIPHAGAMCLLDAVVASSEQHIECTASSHRLATNPLRRDGRLAALHLAEYAAQAMAAHGALLSGTGARPGMLAALRDIRLHADRIDTIDSDLTIRATRRVLQRDGSLYDFSVEAGGRLLAEGRIAIALS